MSGSLISRLPWRAQAGRAPFDLYRARLLEQADRERPGVYVTWLGTAGILVSDGTTDLLIDPYVSRFSLWKVVLGFGLSTDPGLVKKWVGRLGAGNVQAVMVSHSHFDHVLDAPCFALETGAPLMGSVSTLNAGRGAGLPDPLLAEVRPGMTMNLGGFSLRIVESRHGPALFGRVPYPGTIEKPLVPPRPARDYRLGATYSILIAHRFGTLLHHGSAVFAPGRYGGLRADVVLLGIAGRGDTGDYLAEVPLRVGARRVIPIHFDDFFKPLDKGISFLHTGHFTEFCETAEKSSVEVRTLPIGGPVRVLPVE